MLLAALVPTSLDDGVRPVAGTLEVAPAFEGDEWDGYISAHPLSTFDHLWGWRSVFSRALGHEPVYLVARRQARVVGVLPLVLVNSLLFGRSVVSLPFLNYGGLLANDDAVAGALLAEALRRAEGFGAAFVELRHLDRQRHELPFRQHKLRMVRPLVGTPDELWNTLDRKVRNQVRKAQKEGLTVVSGGADLVPEFYEVFAENMRDLGTPVYPKVLFREVFRAFPDDARVFIVRLDQKPIAAGVSLSFRGVTLNPWASSLRAFRHLCPNMLLYWAMLERALVGGATAFDFGRSSPGAGTHQFKLQWGAVESPLYWEYLLLTCQTPPDHGPSNPRFEKVIDLWKKLPLGLANAVGPLIARHLP